MVQVCYNLDGMDRKGPYFGNLTKILDIGALFCGNISNMSCILRSTFC